MKSDHAFLKKTIRFLRVSTRSQVDTHAYGFEAQERSCILNERRHGLQVVDEVREIGSGIASQRLGLERLMERAEESGAVAVSIAAVDRLSRHLLDGSEFLNRLLDSGVTLYAADVHRPIHRDDRDAIAEFSDRVRHAYSELDVLARRTMGGRMAKALGVQGTPTPPIRIAAFGWVHGAVYPAEAEIVRRVYSEVLSLGAARVAEQLNRDGLRKRSGEPWAKADILRMVRNPLYRGVHEYGRQAHCERCHAERAATKLEVREQRVQCKLCGADMRLDRVTVPVEAMVSEPDWETANRALDARRNVRAPTGKKLGRAATVGDLAVLKGRLRCGHCGAPMVPVARKGKAGVQVAYACRNAINKHEFVEGRICPNAGSHLGAPLHETVRRELVAVLSDGRALGAFLERQTDHAARRRREVEAARTALEKEIRAAEEMGALEIISRERVKELKLKRMSQLDRLSADREVLGPMDEAALRRFVGSSSLPHLLGALQANIAVWTDERIQISCEA